MRPIKRLPPAEYLRKRLSYDPETGELRWKPQPREAIADLRCWASWNGKHAGKIAGTWIDGCLHVCLDYRYYWAHRIIWKMMTNEEPPASIDHHDRDRANNRWLNLREATRTKQAWNAQFPNRTTGYRGVKVMGKRFQARIKRDGVMRYLGTYDTPEEASAIYEAAARELHGEFYANAS